MDRGKWFSSMWRKLLFKCWNELSGCLYASPKLWQKIVKIPMFIWWNMNNSQLQQPNKAVHSIIIAKWISIHLFEQVHSSIVFNRDMEKVHVNKDCAFNYCFLVVVLSWAWMKALILYQMSEIFHDNYFP